MDFGPPANRESISGGFDPSVKKRYNRCTLTKENIHAQAHLSTQKEAAPTGARLPQPHAYQGRAPGPQGTKAQGAKAVDGQHPQEIAGATG